MTQATSDDAALDFQELRKKLEARQYDLYAAVRNRLQPVSRKQFESLPDGLSGTGIYSHKIREFLYSFTTQHLTTMREVILDDEKLPRAVAKRMETISGKGVPFARHRRQFPRFR